MQASSNYAGLSNVNGEWIVGIMDWDSDFFQKKIGELLIDEKNVMDEVTDDFDVIYVKSKQNTDLEIKSFEVSFFK